MRNKLAWGCLRKGKGVKRDQEMEGKSSKRGKGLREKERNKDSN